MSVQINLSILSFLLISAPVRGYLNEIENASRKLDELLVGVRAQRDSRDCDEEFNTWQEYEFGTGVGNREELSITNVSTRFDAKLSNSTRNYQHVEVDGENFLAGSSDDIFSLYKLDLQRGRVIYATGVKSARKIFAFKLLSLPNSADSEALILAILCVESDHGTDLLWFRFDGENLVRFSSWPVQKRVELLQFFHHEGQNRLLILMEEIEHFGQKYSPIDIYGFSVIGESLNLRLTERKTVPKTFDLRVCRTYESTMMVLQRREVVSIYEYRGDGTEGLFGEPQNITSNGMRNVVCFESGYIRYLVTSGPEATLFDFFENEFQHESDYEDVFNDVGEVAWIQSLPVDTYRSESILLLQLKNNTIIVLSWNGRGFGRTALPNIELRILDLSAVTVIPRYGFVYGDLLIKIDTTLEEKPRPARDEMEKMLQSRQALADLLRKQELILDETERLINDSYFVKPDVTGFWNLTEVEADVLVIEDRVAVEEVAIGTKKIELDELLSDLGDANDDLLDLESTLQEIRRNLARSVPIGKEEVTLIGKLFVEGGFDVGKTMSVTNFTFGRLNGFTFDEILMDLTDRKDGRIIEGEKRFESVEAENLRAAHINGLPISEVVFDEVGRDWSMIDFSKSPSYRLKVEGNLNFSIINGVDWEALTERLVSRSGRTAVSGVTIVEGDLVANEVNIDRLNGLRYPEDYVLSNSSDAVVVTGGKEFNRLSVGTLDLDRLRTINGRPIVDYVTLHRDVTVTEEMTFEDLDVTDTFQIDGKITGLPDAGVGPLMNETSSIVTDVVFGELKIAEDMEVENSLNGTTWSALDDLVSAEEELVEITGHKAFLSEVEVGSELIITRQRINGRAIDEFVTIDTDQTFPNLERITGNVTFDKVTRGDVEFLKRTLAEKLDDRGQPECLAKVLVFKVPPIVDKLFLDTINEKMSAQEFSAAVDRTFSNVRFRNLEVETLRAREVSPVTLNGRNFEELKTNVISRTKPQTLTGNYEIGTLETASLKIGTMDGRTIEELENLRTRLDHLYDRIVNGNVEIGNLTVTGLIATRSVNGETFANIFDPDTMGTVIFSKDVHIKNLAVLGLTNGINFTDFFEDVVKKSDRHIVITGLKKFDRINCGILDAANLNGRPVEHILDPDRHQVITGSVRVNGTVTVTDHFATSGKIGGVSWQGVRERFRYLGNGTYSVNGNVRFTSENVEIGNLFTDSILGVRFDDFLRSVVYKNSKNITIDGPLVFKEAVTINAPFSITESFNDLDLQYFYDHAVRIDRPFVVKSKVVFDQNIDVREDLIVHEHLEAKTVGDVDLKDLYENAAFVDRPTYITGTTTLDNVIFESDVEVDFVNDLDMSRVITLKGEQTFDTLHGPNIAVGKIEISGKVNDHDLGAIFDDTFMLTGDQNITGKIIFRGSVHMRHDFDARLINGVDPRAMIPLDGNGSFIGNFVFEKPIVLHGNYEASDTINDIDLNEWRVTSVTKTFPMRQIVRGAWTIHGNVHFHGNVDGNDFLDDVNVRALVDDLHRMDVEQELVMEDVQKDLRSICEDLSILKRAAERQLYKYKYFEYLQVLNFDRSIVCVHQFESDDFDYMLVNYDTCHLDIFVFTGREFAAVTDVSNVGYVERWFTMRFDGEIYFLAVGKNACNRSAGNLWKLSDDRFVHVEDLGNVTDARKISENEFLVVVDGLLVRRSLLHIYQRSLSVPKSYKIGNDGVKFVRDSREVLLAGKDSTYEYQFENDTGKQRQNCFGTDELASFRLGIYEREVFIYHDVNLSEEYLFISDNNLDRHKILQTIETQRPSSITVINFEGLVENFLIFIENHSSLQIYEYRGIEGFVYRETIKMNVEKIFKMRLRRYSKLAKKHCIAAVQDKRLVILEAKMYGERLDMGRMSCED